MPVRDEQNLYRMRRLMKPGAGGSGKVRDTIYWRDRPKPPGWTDDEITWCEEMAQYYMEMAAFLRDREGEHKPSPLSRTDA